MRKRIRLLDNITFNKVNIKIETSCFVQKSSNDNTYEIEVYGVNHHDIKSATFRGKTYDVKFIKGITQFGLKGNAYVYELTLKIEKSD